jgi:ATP-dependent RNA helicase DDX49/DBP8
LEITFLPQNYFDLIDKVANKMAPPKTDKEDFENSDLSDTSDVEQSDVEDRAPKRRRLSESSNDSYVAPAPLPTLSRIKKKGEVDDEPEEEEEEPVTIADAIELGRTSDHSTFATLDVAPWLVASLSTLAIKRPTAIQKACIPEILKGKDCIGGSRTGSGKTMAFAVPIMQQWALNPFGIYALILTPTRYVLMLSVIQVTSLWL